MNKKSKTPQTAKAGQNSSLPGWPGYRTRTGRSGYDPIDSRAEGAHLAGSLVRQFFGLQIRTRRPAALLGLAGLGLALLAPLLLALAEAMTGASQIAWGGWVFLSGAGLAGLAALANLGLSLLRTKR